MDNSIKTPIAIVAAAVIVGLGLYFGLQGPAPQPVIIEPIVQPEPGLSERTVNLLEIHLGDIQQVLRSIEEASRRDGFADMAEHAGEIVELAQQLRLLTADMPRRDSQLIRLLVDRIQHAAHELEDSAKVSDHEEAHHAFENLEHEVESLDDVLSDLV